MTISHETEGKWKSLTNDVLTLILSRLNTNSDLCRFRSICKSWRSFATPVQPHQLFPLTLPPLLPNYRSLSLSPTLIYIFSPNYTVQHQLLNNVWLIKVSESGENKWALLNPLTKHKFYLSSSRVFRERVDLMAYRNLEVGRSYRAQLVTNRGDEDTFGFEEFASSITLRKVVVRIGEEFGVLGLYGYGKIAIWNSGDEDWKIVELETGMTDKKSEFDDVICFDGKFLAVDRTRRLVMIDSAAEAGQELVEVVCATEEGNGQYFYLLECDYKLYLVNKIVNPMPTNYYDEEEEWVVDKTSVGKPLGFKVFVLNEREKRWERVRSLGNKVLFVSRDAAFSVCAEDLGWSKGDCIYFEGVTGYDDDADMSFGLNAGVYTLEDGSISTFGSSEDRWTGIFWPPSSWFVQNEEYPECAMHG